MRHAGVQGQEAGWGGPKRGASRASFQGGAMWRRCALHAFGGGPLASPRRAGAAATTLRYYRSTDAAITSSDTSVGTDAVGGLSAGATSSESTRLTAQRRLVRTTTGPAWIR